MGENPNETIMNISTKTSEMGQNPNETIMNISTKTSEMGENPNETIMNISTKTSEMGENPNETIMNPQTNKPFDIILNEEFGKYQTKGYNKNWFVPIVKEQSDMDLLNEIRNDEYPHWRMERNFPKILLEVVKDEDKNIISIYTLYSKGGKLYRVVSQKDYGVIKSRMELINGEYVPYEKCDLVLFDGKVDEYDEYDDNLLKKSFSYKNGVKDGECFTYYVDGQTIRNEETNEWEKYHYYEKTTYKNGKKDGEFENTKYGVKGNYINNKKNGVWKDSYKNIYSNLKSTYQSKFNLSIWDTEKFIGENFEILTKYDGKELSEIGIVFYVNDVLNGDFTIRRWYGKFELGLPNGIVSNSENHNWKDVINSKLFDNGTIVSKVRYDSGDREENEEITYFVENFENGFKKSLIELSSNSFDSIPIELTSKTNRFLNEDVFYTIVKNELNNCSLESFLEKFVVLSKIDYETNNYDRPKGSYKIGIGTKKLEYGFNKYIGNDLTKYLVEECGYPYYEEKECNSWNNNTKYYQILNSEEYRYSYDYHPMVYSLSESGEVTKLFINGELIDETIDNETNPIVLEFQKEVLQNLSNEMKSSYEREIHKKQIEEIEKNNQLEIEREVKGFSINSFPLD